MSLSLRELVEVLVHDIKNPLASMITNAHFLRENAPHDDARDAAVDIAAAARWVNRLLGNINDLARCSAHEALLHDGVANMTVALREAESVMNVHARDRQVKVRVDISSGDFKLGIDEDLAQRMCETLIEACVRHALRGSEVQVQARREKSDIVIAVICAGTPLNASERVAVFSENAFIGDNCKRQRIAPAFGLPFVHRVSVALGGRVEALPSDTGLHLLLRLPTEF